MMKKVETLINPERDTANEVFVLPEHKEKGFSTFEQAQDYAKHISAISREYTPLSWTSLPARVVYALVHEDNVGNK